MYERTVSVAVRLNRPVVLLHKVWHTPSREARGAGALKTCRSGSVAPFTMDSPFVVPSSLTSSVI